MQSQIRFFIVLAFFIPLGIHAEENPKTSVFVIAPDVLTWKMIEEAETPNFDFLRRFGVEAKRLTPVDPPDLLPSTVSMFTGLLPEHHGVTWKTANSFQSYRARTLFECLSEFGHSSESVLGNRDLRTLIKPLTKSSFQTVPGDHAALWATFKKTVEARPNTNWFTLQLPDTPNIETLDSELGSFLQLIAQEGRLDRSVILLTAGQPSSDPSNPSAWIVWGKNILHRDPLEDVAVVDTMPSLLALFGLSSGDGLDGIIRQNIFEEAPNISTHPVCAAPGKLNELFLQMIRVAVFSGAAFVILLFLLFRMRHGKKPPAAPTTPTPPEPVRIIRL